MTPHDLSLSVQNSENFLAISLLAALADGELDEQERNNLSSLASELGGEIEASMRQILLGQHTLSSVVSAFPEPHQKTLAYELARAVCESDSQINPREQAFLDDLRQRLGLRPAEAQAADAEVDAILLAEPVSTTLPQPAVSNDARILRYAILCGALEILPSSLATMAILPLQIKLVHAIAKSHGVTLGTSNIKDFLAVLGIGVTSQMVEGFARKLLAKLGKSVAGQIGRFLGNQAAGSALSFATTYAIGHIADKYYAGGQTLPIQEIRQHMAELLRRAQELHAAKLPEIQAQARSLNPSQIFEIVRGEPTP